jgi:hypothetical protein
MIFVKCEVGSGIIAVDIAASGGALAGKDAVNILDNLEFRCVRSKLDPEFDIAEANVLQRGT